MGIHSIHDILTYCAISTYIDILNDLPNKWKNGFLIFHRPLLSSKDQCKHHSKKALVGMITNASLNIKKIPQLGKLCSFQQ